jgi:hypothetical protein
VWAIAQPGERAFVADGWGQRDWKNSDIGATLPYFVRRTTGDGPKLFVSVFEGVEGNNAFVRTVAASVGNTSVRIETADGTDYIVSGMDERNSIGVPLDGGEHTLSGRFAAASLHEGKLVWKFAQP